MNNNNKLPSFKSERNYGPLTDVSKLVNTIFGDKSSRTVSMRTTHGFQNILRLNISEQDAEDIVHLAMVGSLLLVKSKNKTANTLGILLIAGLFVCYHNG